CGWLSGLDTAPHDFAGSTVVHSVGGWAALAGVLLLGPRMGKYKDGKVQAIPGHNMGLAAIGTLILWLGWFGFNPGSTMAAVPGIGYIAVTTNMAAACGALFATITAWVVLGKPDLTMILNGCLAGLVAITAPCAVVTVGGAAIIGSIAGILVVLSVLFWDRIRIDDPVGALSVHLVCGIWGTLAVGLFAAPKVLEMGLGVSKPGLFYGGDASQLLAQLLAVGTVGAFVMVASLVLWAALKATVGIRVSPAEEEEGLDIGEHGMEAYPGFGFGADVVSSTTPDLGEVIPATVPGQKRFSVVVEGADPKDLIGAWTQLCGAPAPPPDFKSLYSFVTTVQGNRFRFRGGDPGAMADTLRRLFQSVLKGSSVTAKLEP
ncbi:MAG: hypothetical protein NZM29_03535, partial [Nitrospira sp.]|nr:hypothetical protein [Nitrospira sp.]